MNHDDVTTFLQFSFSTRPLPTVASAILRDGPLLLRIGVILLFYFGNMILTSFYLSIYLSISYPRLSCLFYL